MLPVDWQTLQGKTIGGRYQLQRLAYEAETTAEFDALADRSPVSVRVTTSAGNAIPVLAGVEHPHIRRVWDFGQDTIDGKALDYVVVETATEWLDAVLVDGPLSVEETRRLADAVLSALDYLHGNGLVYMGLRPETVIRAGGTWNLAAPECPRHASIGDAASTKLMLARAAHVPPEAFRGEISTAWDMWSFGTLLNRVLIGPRPKGEPGAPKKSLRRPELPPPFDRIVADCLQPDPGSRATARAVISVLENSAVDGVNEPSVSDAGAEAPVSRVRAFDTSSPTPVERKRRVRTYEAPVVVDAPAMAAEQLAAPEPVVAQVPDPVLPAAERPFRSPPFRAPFSEPDVHRRSWVSAAAMALGGVLVVALLYTQLHPRSDVPEYGSKSRTVDSVPQDSAKPAPAVPQNGTADRRAAINELLDRWVETTRSKDVQGNVELYAPRVEQFFNRTNVSRADVLREKSELFSKAETIKRFDVSKVQIESYTPDRATVSFRKDWNFRGAGSTAGAEKARLVLVWGTNGWQITREQEVTVYWSKKRR